MFRTTLPIEYAAVSTTSSVPEASFEVMLGFFKSLANESRLRMVGLLLKRPRHVKELAAEKLALVKQSRQVPV